MISDYYVNLHFNQAIAQRTGYAFKIGDKGCTFHFHCEDLDPSGMYPHIVFNHPNNTCVEGVPTGSGRDYAYTIQGNEFAVIGKTVVDLKFYDALDATQRISTASFIIEILPDTYTDFLTPSSPYADSLETAKEELEDAEQDLTDMDALFAQTLQDYIDAFGNTAPINPRGAYDPNELYKPRDAVYFTSGGKTLTYLNNLECTGVDPTNTSNWQPIIDITGIPAIIDNCTSTSTTDALSANQGRVLNENIEAIVDVYGAKQMIPYPYDNTNTTKNGITITENDDGTVTLSGTAGSDVYVLLNETSLFTLDKGTYTLSGCPSGGGLSSYNLYLNGIAQSIDSGDGATFTLSNATTTQTCIFVKSGTAILTPITFSPMLKDARITSPARTPYAKTNKQLTEDVASIFDTLPNNAGAHNRYRGKALTIDADFWSHISDGTFEDQFVGDTITINGRTYILAHANYWLHTGDTACETNHWVVISPNMGNAKMNSDNSTVGGYLGSGFRSGTNHDSTPNTALADAIATIKSDFGASHILSHREYLDNAVTGGYPSAGTWIDSEAELMSQIMVYGNRFYDPSTNLGATIPTLYSVDKSQLALYAQRPDMITDRTTWWLRDVASAAYFNFVFYHGLAAYDSATYSCGVRLAFGIIA